MKNRAGHKTRWGGKIMWGGAKDVTPGCKLSRPPLLTSSAC